MEELKQAFAREAIQSTRQALILNQCIAIISILNRKGFITNGEVKEELERLKTPKDQPDQRQKGPEGSTVQSEREHADEGGSPDAGAPVLRMPDSGADTPSEGSSGE